MRRWWLVAALVAGCAQTRATPLEMVPALRAAAPSLATLDAAARRAPQADPLVVRETGLGGVRLGMSPDVVRATLGEPATRSGDTWRYDPPRPGARLTLRFEGGKLRQIRAWAPGDAETRTLVRLLDDAARVRRKYGAAPVTLRWGDGEGWLYPAANVAFVVTPADATGDRVVDGLIVGL